jgi:hypothetical protein
MNSNSAAGIRDNSSGKGMTAGSLQAFLVEDFGNLLVSIQLVKITNALSNLGWGGRTANHWQREQAAIHLVGLPADLYLDTLGQAG